MVIVAKVETVPVNDTQTIIGTHGSMEQRN